MTFPAIISGLLLGLGAALPIGPVNVEIARRAIRSGFRAGAALGCGAVTVDVTYAIISALGVRPLLGYPAVITTLTILSIALLIYLGVMSLRSAWRSRNVDAQAVLAVAAPPSLHGAYVTGLLMTLLNPITLAFWFLVVPGTTVKLGLTAHDLPAICLGVFIATLTWVISFAGALSWLGRLKKSAWIVVADAVGGFVLLGFAAVAAWGAFAE